MKLTLSIETHGQAFTDDPAGQSAEALREVAARIVDGHRDGVIRDYNGGRVGRWELTPE
ncbi:hypothetical protein [Micromonospora chalcea]|uniref:hypothetical protein n=1 Tax=Micromonospora chalcea TaxID=1874 RepID=UPI003D752228